ncbi:trem-like transcript 2 protein isoform X2 [Marmota marmota marmota]|uniref:trem-like transcript 2 protein isoform X2 n=1 Tax=Marmota marmota marmota TaxID=9994 RepID=UPI002093155B|nr:trem-like transcript 2 protein isoform X2 [Marmota marmota marmota]
MAPMFLLLLLWLQDCTSGLPAESVYNKVQHLEGETLSVQCSYKGRKNRVEGKVWCKVRKRRCEPGFARVWVKGPGYLLQDDVQAKVVNITMGALKRQDSGRYWCMRNSSGILYPMMGIQLEVSPALTTQRSSPLTRLDILKGRVLTTAPAPTSDPDTSSTSSTTLFIPRLLTLARLLPSTASGTTGPTSVTSYSFISTRAITTGPTKTRGPTKTMGPPRVTVSPSDARASPAIPTSISTTSGYHSSHSPTTGICHNQLPSFSAASEHTGELVSPRPPPPDSDLTVLVAVLTFLPAPVMMVMVYGFWKKRHMGSYSLCNDSAGAWAEPPRRLEPLWKPA